MRRNFSLVTSAVAVLLGMAMAPAAAQAADLNDAVVANIKDAGGKIVQLAEAIPEDKYGWRPADGVRSVSEVFMHVAGSGYMLGNRLGGPPPPEGARGLEQNVTAKAEVIAKLKDALDALNAAAGQTDMSAPAKLFGGREGTNLDMALLIVGHTHEHLGQLIAYARSIGVTPPWSN